MDNKVFVETLRERFLSGQSNQFLIYGNVQDYLRWEDGEYYPLLPFLNHFFNTGQRIQVHFNISGGIHFLNPKDQLLLKKAYGSSTKIQGDAKRKEAWFDKALLESAIYPQVGIKFIQELLQLEVPGENGLRQFSIIMDYADTLAPQGTTSSLNDNDRQRLVTLLEWLTAPDFIESPHLAIFIASTLSSVNERLVQLPTMTLLSLARPDHKARLNFIRHQYHHHKKEIKIENSQTKTAELTAGLTLRGIEHLFLSARYKKEKLNGEDILNKTNEILSKELGNMIEIFKPTRSLKDVIGATKLKKELKRQIKLINSNKKELTPVGILVSGPNGVGKTFIFEAFAQEIDFLVIKLKKIRSQWFGETDSFFEKIKSVLTSLGKVIVFIDEADTAFGGRDKNTHETERRLFGNLIQMMGDPANRGKVIWLLLTARPDRLEPDVKRSGRAGLHIPVFDPEGEDRLLFIEWIFDRSDLKFKTLPEGIKETFLELTGSYSPADFNEWGNFIKAEQHLKKSPLKPEEIISITKEYIPADLKAERRLQTLQAAKECSLRSLLPKELKNKSYHDEIKKLLVDGF